MTMENMTMETSIDHHRSHLPMPWQKKYIQAISGSARAEYSTVLAMPDSTTEMTVIVDTPRGGGDPAREMVSSHDLFHEKHRNIWENYL